MATLLITAPAAEPLSLTDVKHHLRVDSSDDDAYLTQLIVAARTHVEAVTQSALISRTLEWVGDDFPGCIELEQPPLISVTSVKYIDGAGVEQTVSTSIYTVDADSRPGRVFEAYGQSWPSPRDIPNAVRVRYVAGFGATENDVPEPIRLAMKVLIASWYDCGEGALMGGVPMAADALLSPYKHRLIA